MTEPGIYLGLPVADYLAIKALSASGIKWLAVSPLDFWARSWLCPDPEPTDETPYTELGEAFHTRICEGRATFYERYATALEPGDYPAAIRTADELREACRDLGLKVGGTKADLRARLLEANPAAEIWDDLLSEHAAHHEGKTLLSAQTIKRIEIAAAMIEKHPELSLCFQGGIPELTVVWQDEETGVLCKARFDYVKPRAAIELKTFGNPLGKSIDAAIYGAIASRGYFVSAAHYLDAWPHMLRFVREGRIFGEASDVLAKLQPDPQYVFVFQQTGVAPLARGKIFPRGMVYDIGKIAVRDARQTFKDCVDLYGNDPWIDSQPISQLDDSEFPAWTGR